MPLLVEAREAQQPTHPRLTSAYLALAVKLQEAAGDMTASTVGQKLSSAIQAAHKGTGKWASYMDHMGDDDSGDVIYSCSGDTMSCPYEMSDNGDGVASTAKLDMDSARKVSPRVTYEDMPDDEDDDGMATMYEAAVYTRGDRPLVERFVSKSERDQMDEGDFAGKGKSFPINKPGDIMAAVHSMGRAGSGNYGPAALKANIIRIAKKKGWAKYLPKAWQGGGDAKESVAGGGNHVAAGGIRLVESTPWPSDEVLELIESATGTEIPIKIIAPGKGSTAFYTPESLKRGVADGIFNEAQIYINHATKTQASERPEGDYRDLAGVIKAGSVTYHESHKRGPGVYGIGVFTPQIAPEVRAKAAISGMSIRADGEAVRESSGRPKIQEGVPVLERFTGLESVDLVTRAGAGGMVLTEAARAANSKQEASMDADELKLLRESVARLSSKETRREAIQEGARILADVSIPDAAKEYIVETVLKESLPMKDGSLDLAKFKESIDAETKRFGAAIGAGPRVVGMGAAPVVEITEAQRAAATEREQAETGQLREAWATLLDEQPGADGKLRIAEYALRGRTA